MHTKFSNLLIKQSQWSRGRGRRRLAAGVDGRRRGLVGRWKIPLIESREALARKTQARPKSIVPTILQRCLYSATTKRRTAQSTRKAVRVRKQRQCCRHRWWKPSSTLNQSLHFFSSTNKERCLEFTECCDWGVSVFRFLFGLAATGRNRGNNMTQPRNDSICLLTTTYQIYFYRKDIQSLGFVFIVYACQELHC